MCTSQRNALLLGVLVLTVLLVVWYVAQRYHTAVVPPTRDGGQLNLVCTGKLRIVSAAYTDPAGKKHNVRKGLAALVAAHTASDVAPFTVDSAALGVPADGFLTFRYKCSGLKVSHFVGEAEVAAAAPAGTCALRRNHRASRLSELGGIAECEADWVGDRSLDLMASVSRRSKPTVATRATCAYAATDVSTDFTADGFYEHTVRESMTSTKPEFPNALVGTMNGLGIMRKDVRFEAGPATHNVSGAHGGHAGSASHAALISAESGLGYGSAPFVQGYGDVENY